MPRTIEITVPTARTDALVATLRDRQEVLGLQVQRDASVKPPGDVLTMTTTNRSLPTVLRLLDAHGIGATDGTSLSTAEPVSLVAPSARERLSHDTSEGSWEEIDTVIGRESNATRNTLGVMAIAGAVAAIGLATNALHLVIAAMVIAPGFEPVLRISLGITTRSTAWRHGLVQTATSYAALLAGALAAAVALRITGTSPLGDTTTYLPDGVLVRYWTTVSATSVLVSALAATAGAILVAVNRSVLTAGVMMALALVPGATLVMSGLVGGDAAVAGKGALRWLIDAVLVLVLAWLVFAWKQAHTHRRPSLL